MGKRIDENIQFYGKPTDNVPLGREILIELEFLDKDKKSLEKITKKSPVIKNPDKEKFGKFENIILVNFIVKDIVKSDNLKKVSYVTGWIDADDNKIKTTFDKYAEIEITDRIDPKKLNLSQKGIDFLKGYESEIKKDGKHILYDDDLGYCTVGYGHLVEGRKSCKSISKEKYEKFKNGLSDKEANDLLKKDIEVRENRIKNIIKVPLYQQEFDAIVSLYYNIEDSLRQDYTIMKCLNKKDYEGAGKAFLLWNKGTVNGQKVILRGLDSRRKAESNIFLKGIYDSTH